MYVLHEHKYIIAGMWREQGERQDRECAYGERVRGKVVSGTGNVTLANGNYPGQFFFKKRGAGLPL
jgi:hypothetical protein